jgi:ribosomal protein S18 acetylase RimI-like enzyme
MAVVFLHHRPELLERAAILLNSEWPRSLEARYVIAASRDIVNLYRKHSIENSCDGLPLSLLMMDDGGCNVIGFVRILSVANREGGALIESLLIDSNMRRRGLGRKLMSQAENYVLK